MAATVEGPATGLLNLEKDLVCFICTEVLHRPLTLIDCLHTFCGSCLKEWFSHQHQKASRSHHPPAQPYTCPTCRDTVKDARRNAMINTLLESFLAANPGKNRTEQEKQEMDQLYKPGDDIMPKVEPRRRRRREDDGTGRRERRTTEASRERGTRERRTTPPPPPSANDRLAPGQGEAGPGNSRSRSREHDERRDRRIHEREERRQRRERLEVPPESRTRESSREEPGADVAALVSPPPTSVRHPDAVVARRDARSVAHQASLRSIASVSDTGSGTGDSLTEEQLMQEIISEGLLDGIDVENLTEAEQDILCEAIAERYRQRHPERTGHGRASASNTEQSPRQQPEQPEQRDLSVDMQALQIEEADRIPRPHRSHGGNPVRPGPGRGLRSTGSGQVDGRQQTSPSVSELALQPDVHTHARRVSDQGGGGRRSSSQARHHTLPSTRAAASSSSVDLSGRPYTATATSTTSTHDAPFLPLGRANSEPPSDTAASGLSASGASHSRRAAQINVASEAATPPRAGSPTMSSPLLLTSTPRIQGIAELTGSDPIVSAPLANVQASFEESFAQCYRCLREGIQYEVHQHCYACDLDLCQRCYRMGYGCNHWFGFGHGATAKFQAYLAQGRVRRETELPHVLVGRQYRQPPPSTVLRSSNPMITTSDPSSRLEEGHFCDRCGLSANSCFWKCDVCNEGEWGFCNACVNMNYCCSHPLLPIAHKSHLARPQSANAHLALPSTHSPAHSIRSSATSMTDVSGGGGGGGGEAEADFFILSITTYCDVCVQPIAPRTRRFHCPAHPSPEAHNATATGDYDICTPCYHNLVKSGRIKREDGPAGWRKCPQGHRMIVTTFEADSDAELRREVVQDLVGGTKMQDDDIAAWCAAMSQQEGAGAGAGLTPAKIREWTWYDPADPAADPASPMPRHVKTRQSAFTPQRLGLGGGGGGGGGDKHGNSCATAASAKTAKFPPDGGFGQACIALWSYYPEEGEAGRGELTFPKYAEIKEVEHINEDWSDGVYAGARGLLPASYVRELS